MADYRVVIQMEAYNFNSKEAVIEYLAEEHGLDWEAIIEMEEITE